MIHVQFWPSTACDPTTWDIAINRVLQEQRENFPGVEIAPTQLQFRRLSFHTNTSIEVGEQIIVNKFVPTIHFIQLSTSDVQEEIRDTFPESILHLDVLARLSRMHVIAIIDLIDDNLVLIKQQLNSVTKVMKTCTVVQNLATPKRSQPPIRVRIGDHSRLTQLAYRALMQILSMTNPTTMTQEP